MTERAKLFWIYGASAAYLAFNVYLILQDKYWGMIAPLALLLVVLYIFSLDKVLLLITFLTPFAINLKEAEFGVGISIPTEPMLFGVLLIFILRLFLDGYADKRVLKHPVSIAIIINLIWIFITCFTSQLPVVSAKFMIARLWFVVPFYFMAVLLFKKFSNIKLFHWLYVIPLIVVIFYTLAHHSQFAFDKHTSNIVMKPFYNDHTAYGAVIAMFIPVFTGFLFSRLYKKRMTRFWAFALLSVMLVGIIFSYSRAAWLSVAIALVIYLIILFRVRFYWILLAFAIMTGVFFVFRYQFLDKLEKNKQDSSTDFLKHIQSISNISSDASNLERINRWSSALRLFAEKPVFGWGPGTYQFVYAPFQRSKEKTIISTNYGDMGNAHSEYFGPLSESGVLGMLTIIAIIITVIITAMKVRRNARSREVRVLSVLVLLGLITYYIHGLLNNFLDTDKASVPFWAFTAMIVALDIYHSGKETREIDTPVDDEELTRKRGKM